MSLRPLSRKSGAVLALVMVPFEVPEGSTRVRVWGSEELRGWGGSSRLDAHVSAMGATPGFMPGPIPPGGWAAEIGVAALTGPEEGNPSGRVGWRLEVFLSHTGFTSPVWEPAPYDTAPVREGWDWYAGDFHVHATHSGSAPMDLTFEYAFTPLPEGGAGLDFITLSDYNTERGWAEIGHHQADHPGKLIIRSAEVITYRGHVNNHGSVTHVDYRTGPVYELRNGTLSQREWERTARDILTDVRAAGGWTQINHPTTFPATVPGFGNVCRGCSWEHSDSETDWSLVDAMEVQTGPSGWAGHEPVSHQQLLTLDDNEPGPNPFTPLAIEWWDRLRREGHRVTAVGSSDSHRAGERSLLYSPIGHPTTMIWAPELSEEAIGTAIRAGHAYVKFFSSAGPDLRWEARLPGSEEVAGIMGDEIAAGSLELTATVLGALPSADTPQLRQLLVLRDGIPILLLPVLTDPLEVTVTASIPGDYRLQLHRGSAIEALTNPITLLSPASPYSGEV